MSASIEGTVTPGGQFASDNYSGICPEAWASLEEANSGHCSSYGDDPWTEKAADRIREIFETDCEVFFVFTGTAANSLAISALCRSYHSVLCHELAHLECDECGAPEFFSNGTKVLLLEGGSGKIDPLTIERRVTRRSDIHYPKPRVVSVTQATEVGVVYQPDELREISGVAKGHGLKLHMDGARFANAAASAGVAPKELTWRCGVDVLCFGGAKNGASLGEAVVFFNRELAREFDYRCKQAGQLASKMRFLSSPWVGLLSGNAWLRHASQANAMARRLRDKTQGLGHVKILYPVEANSVFMELSVGAVEALRGKGWQFYTFIGDAGCRFMCSWSTTEAEVDALAADLAALG